MNQEGQHTEVSTLQRVLGEEKQTKLIQGLKIKMLVVFSRKVMVKEIPFEIVLPPYSISFISMVILPDTLRTFFPELGEEAEA